MSGIVNDSSLPPSTSVPGLARGMAKAHEAYGQSTAGLPTCVIFLIQDTERNVFDQRHLEYELNQTHGVRTFRLPFSRVLEDTKVDAGRKLIYTPPQSPTKQYEVTVVYFRAGYAPTEYETQAAWDARLHLERSAAIKCPSVLLSSRARRKCSKYLQHRTRPT